jgi:hypothetical protein
VFIFILILTVLFSDLCFLFFILGLLRILELPVDIFGVFCFAIVACVFESKWKALSKRIPRKNQIDNDDPSKKSEDRSRPLLQHRQAALNKVKTSLDCTNLEINWHLDPL